MHSRVFDTPTGTWLVEPGLEYHLPPMGYCTACGRGFFNQPPEGPPLTYCGCLGVSVGLRKASRRFCPGCGNRDRCRCPGDTRRQRPPRRPQGPPKPANNAFEEKPRMTVEGPEDSEAMVSHGRGPEAEPEQVCTTVISREEEAP